MSKYKRRQFSATSRLVALVVTFTFSLVGIGQIAGTSVREVTLLAGGTAPIPAGDALVGQAPSSATLSLEIALQPRDPAALTAEVEAVSTPGSPQYHQFLAPGEFAQLYGPTPSTVSAVASALRSQGFTVGVISGSGLSLPVTGSVAQVEAAFDTSISAYRQPSGQIGYDNTHSPSVPATIAPDIEGVVGLDTLVQPVAATSGPLKALRPLGDRRERTSLASASPATTQPTPNSSCTFSGALSANQLAQDYDLDPLYSSGDFGAGTTVALAEFGAANYVPSDISTFASCYGITSYQLSEEGDTSLGVGDDSDETELDVETVLSLAPSASIEVYQAGTTYDDGGYYALFNKIVSDDSAKIVSVSYETCEAEESSQMMAEENTILQVAATQGQSFFVSSGDTGSEACNGGGPCGVDTGTNPTAQAVDTSTGTLYVANEGSDSISVVDEASGSVVATVPTGSEPDAVDFDSAASEVFVANLGSNSLTTFSTATCSSLSTSGCASPATISNSQMDGPTALAVDGATLYVGNSNYSVTANSLSGTYAGGVALRLMVPLQHE